MVIRKFPLRDCATCGYPFMPTSSTHIYCILCGRPSRYIKKDKPFKSTPEQRKNAWVIRLKNTLANMPNVFRERARETVERRVGLPACLISVNALARRVWRDIEIRSDTATAQAGYHIVAEMLKEYGGTLSSFESVKQSAHPTLKGPYHQIYRFKPLKER